MQAHRSGDGPAVVLLPGAGLVGLDFLNVHERVAPSTTSVVYDRAGTGWSDPADLPHTAAELHTLLRTAGVPAPYVLVAHSLGGAYARRFAQHHSGAVAGVVSLEGFHEDWNDHMPPERHVRETARLRADRSGPPT